MKSLLILLLFASLYVEVEAPSGWLGITGSQPRMNNRMEDTMAKLLALAGDMKSSNTGIQAYHLVIMRKSHGVSVLSRSKALMQSLPEQQNTPWTATDAVLLHILF